MKRALIPLLFVLQTFAAHGDVSDVELNAEYRGLVARSTQSPDYVSRSDYGRLYRLLSLIFQRGLQTTSLPGISAQTPSFPSSYATMTELHNLPVMVRIFRDTIVRMLREARLPGSVLTSLMQSAWAPILSPIISNPIEFERIKARFPNPDLVSGQVVPYLLAAISGVQTAQDFLLIMTEPTYFMDPVRSGAIEFEYSQAWGQSISKFLDLNPTYEQILQAKRMITVQDAAFALINELLVPERVQRLQLTPAQFFEIMSFNSSTSRATVLATWEARFMGMRQPYEDTLQPIWRRVFPLFMSLNPSRGEISRALYLTNDLAIEDQYGEGIPQYRCLFFL